MVVVRLREVKGVDGGVLEDEFWVFRLEDYPNEEDCHQDDDDEADDCSTDSTGGSASSTATTVVSALFGRHWYYETNLFQYFAIMLRRVMDGEDV
ncbi:unnamed protein product [Arabidopsis thaliana]|uniref:Uncharacterized protein n=1 Tax=Arabidopsis thaliana TaxID=3702 RepID=A0A654FMM7_ARATH|nr:unnamed protein product [Arabidopsis thaliana]VYS62112.1 unnamed protein product [Arabidopsis thaliana]